LKSSSDESFVKNNLKSILGKDVEIKNRYEQNSFIYRIMKIEKWIVFSILTFILIIASFNMIGSLSMVAIDKKRDISVLQTLGANTVMIKQIFLLEGLIAAVIGTLLGLFLGTLICAGQKYFHWLKLGGNSFVIDAYPINLQALDFVRVILVMMLIGIATSWFPAQRAAQQTWDLKSR
jgi:lipoprotein-releasing system permease protein